ncbi:hypothetical protein GGI1_06757 [Acidithiobacillus sp. GGI-221]|nr:hypothetical protein GGI1_06757 [Acidithiobacillus sp. GGI-221]
MGSLLMVILLNFTKKYRIVETMVAGGIPQPRFMDRYLPDEFPITAGWKWWISFSML